jgi:hypothetical protein
MEGTMSDAIDNVAKWRITRDSDECHERGSPEYWWALYGRAMLDRNGTRLTVRYEGDDSIIVTPTGGAPERWHRLSAAALDLMPVEASATLPTALPPQGTGA